MTPEYTEPSYRQDYPVCDQCGAAGEEVDHPCPYDEGMGGTKTCNCCDNCVSDCEQSL